MDDGYGQKLYQTVEMYADDQGTKYLFIFKIRNIFQLFDIFLTIILELWISDFVNVWIKMSQNGYGSEELIQGPKEFWTHL